MQRHAAKYTLSRKLKPYDKSINHVLTFCNEFLNEVTEKCQQRAHMMEKLTGEN